MPDIEYLDKLIEWAAAEDEKARAGLPSHWEQGDWIVVGDDPKAPPYDPNCGTACCIAGKVALEAGAQPRLMPIGHHYSDTRYWSGVDIVLPDGTPTDVENFATERLGLTDDQALHLFAGHNDLDDLRTVVAAIKAGCTDYDELATFRETHPAPAVEA